MSQTDSANQIVGYNLARIRKALGLSQEEAAIRLEPHLGTRWSKTVYSAAERSYHGKRIRQFTADDLVAFALAFRVPLAYFFLPAGSDDSRWRSMEDLADVSNPAYVLRIQERES